MPSYQIHSTDETLPALSLPSRARPFTHPDYEHDVDSDPPEIEPVEHRLRVDFIEGGPLTPQQTRGANQPLARQYAAQTLSNTFQSEQRYYATLPDENRFSEAPAFLESELTHPFEEFKTIQLRRRRWYTEHIPHNLDQVLETVESLYPNDHRQLKDVNEMVGVVMLPDEIPTDEFVVEHGLDEEFVGHEDTLDDFTSPSEYGISLPAPILVGDYHTRSRYSLIPWSDGLVCACPYKQKRPSRVMCKHELAATIRLVPEERYVLPIDAGVDVPQRARRFLSPTIATQHTPRLPRNE